MAKLLLPLGHAEQTTLYNATHGNSANASLFKNIIPILLLFLLFPDA